MIMSVAAQQSMANRWALSRRERLYLVAVLLLLAALIAYPAWGNAYEVAALRDVLLFGLFALSLDYLWGKAGTLSFGHATFFGIGAYGMAIVTVKLQPDPAYASLLGLGFGLGLAGFAALLVGYFLFFGGVRGAYFAIVTLALTIIAQHIAVGWSSVTGGDAGLIGVPPLGVSFGGVELNLADPVALYYCVVIVCTAALASLWLACRGHYGKVLAAIQDNELRARTLGHHTALHLLVVFTLSAMIAALAGGIYATATGFVAPDMIALLMSTEVIMWVAVGGRGTLIGPFIGTYVVWNLQQQISSIDSKLWPLFIGAFFITMVFLFPDGILSLVGQLRKLWRRFTGRRAEAAP